MATDTYLELVSDVITETGLNSGNAPSSIAAATGDAAKVAYWVRVADLRIQRERIDWDFLWDKPQVQLAQDANVIPGQSHTVAGGDTTDETALINKLAKNRLAIIDANGEAHFPDFMEWSEFSTLYDYVALETSDVPAFYSMSPARVIKLSANIESAGMLCTYEYWRKPLRFRADADTSRIPDDFSRLIVVLAKIMYAEHEDAPEVSAGAHEEYEHMFNQLLAAHAPDSQWSRMQSNDDYMVVETP